MSAPAAASASTISRQVGNRASGFFDRARPMIGRALVVRMVELRSGSDPLRQLTTPETASIWLYLLPSYSWMPIVPDAGEPVSFMSVGPETPS